MLDLYVFNQQLDIIGEVSEYINLEIEKKYDDYGTLILDVQVTPEIVSLMKVGNYISTQEEPRVGYVIQHINLKEDNKSVLTVVAFSLNFLLTYRTIYPQQYYRDTHENVIRLFIDNNAIQPSDQNRVIPNLVLGPASGIGNVIASTRIGTNLLAHSMEIANSILATVDVFMNLQDKVLEVVVSKGENRTVNQSELPRVVFSESYDNILQQDYFYSLIDYKSSPIVAGEGEGALRNIVNVNEISGLNRREILIDARDLQSSYTDEQGVQQTLTPEEYTDALISRGASGLSQYKIVETFEALIDNSQFVYNRDFFIGDMVTVTSEKIGVSIDVLINGVKIVSNSTGVRFTPSLGSGIPSAYKRGGK